VSGEFSMPRSEAHKALKWMIGVERAEDSIPLASVAATDAVVTLSSDWDVSTVNPFVGLANAVSRGKQRVSIKVGKVKNSNYASI